MLNINILTLFADMFPGVLGASIPGRAMDNLWQYNIINIRDFSDKKSATVDDTPYGGGDGMIINAEVIDRALNSINPDKLGLIVYLSPKGEVLNQAKLAEFSKLENLTLVCGRYEGIDQRVIDKWKMTELSIGDYILSGGEVCAQVLIDGIVRLIPGALGGKNSTVFESFSNGLLEHPHYTRPAIWQGSNVPDVLLSGNHENIAKWRLFMQQKITKSIRPDLWRKYNKEIQ